MAGTLEQRGEESLRTHRALPEEYDRLVLEQAPQLTAAEKARLQALAREVPTRWHASQTTAADRKDSVRLLVERVVVQVRAARERTEVEIVWRGGLTTKHAVARSVSREESLHSYQQRLVRIRQLRRDGRTIAQVARHRNKEGYRTPRSRKGDTSTSVRKLWSRLRKNA